MDKTRTSAFSWNQEDKKIKKRRVTPSEVVRNLKRKTRITAVSRRGLTDLYRKLSGTRT